MRLVGSKGGSGIAQWIISEMPYHRVYVEAFLGKGIVFQRKLPAAENIGIELDPKVISGYWHRRSKTPTIINSDAICELPQLNLNQYALVYADPPYLMESRSCKRAYYAKELLTVEDHQRLLSVLTSLQCMVMISGYASELYASVLKEWRTSWKWTTNRRGKLVKEWLWMNFPQPALFHDTRFIGSDYTDRQRIKRKCVRWSKKFLSLPAGERAAVFNSISSLVDDRSQPRMSLPPVTQS